MNYYTVQRLRHSSIYFLDNSTVDAYKSSKMAWRKYDFNNIFNKEITNIIK